MVSVDRSARLMADLIERRVASSTVPVFPWVVLSRVLRSAPAGLIARMG